jgi:hypothetical protein
MMPKAKLALVGVLCVAMGAVSAAQQQPQIHEEVTVSWWLVPVYAVDKTGAPVLNLAPEDLRIYIKGLKVEHFSLIKKQFRVTEPGKPAPAPRVPGPAPTQKKMVFLVFDAAFSPYNLLARAKTIADTVIAQSDKTAQYVLLSIEPFAGLNYIVGPTHDLGLVAKSMKKYIAGKKSDYLLEASAMDRNEIQNVYPEGDGRNPSSRQGYGSMSARRGGQREVISSPGLPGTLAAGALNSRIDWRDKKRVASCYTSALMTLDAVLGQFREHSKVVYLYSCGIPDEALLDRTDFPAPGLGGVEQWHTYFSADTVAFDTLTMIGRHLNESGAILFLVNPAGTRIDETDRDSGEQSLRILATESGGRYFEGAEKEIAQQVNSMEGGYYEISFPDKPEYAGEELDFEIRSSTPDVQIFTVRKVGREKSYADMTELEKEVVVLNILNKGPFAQTNQKVSFVAAQDVLQDGNWLICQVPLPPEIARSEWTVFKIARNFDTGAVFMEKEIAVPSIPSIQVRMKWRGQEFRHDLVFANARTGTILIWQ